MGRKALAGGAGSHPAASSGRVGCVVAVASHRRGASRCPAACCCWRKRRRVCLDPPHVDVGEGWHRRNQGHPTRASCAICGIAPRYRGASGGLEFFVCTGGGRGRCARGPPCCARTHWSGLKNGRWRDQTGFKQAENESGASRQLVAPCRRCGHAGRCRGWPESCERMHCDAGVCVQAPLCRDVFFPAQRGVGCVQNEHGPL